MSVGFGDLDKIDAFDQGALNALLCLSDAFAEAGMREAADMTWRARQQVEKRARDAAADPARYGSLREWLADLPKRQAARAIPAPVYGARWRKNPRCHVCRRRFPTVADYRSHYLKEHHHPAGNNGADDA